jgi:3-deoxy-D-manno-octulosonate 8-phosphate phosphatase (KDO 8-P phosphatase)
MGDDLPDIAMFKCAGLPVAVADAALETRESAVYITKRPGGFGAVREMCEIILKAKNAWPKIDGISEKTKLGFT